MPETLPETTKTPPRSLRYRDADDLHRQLNMNRMNALALSLQSSQLVQPLRAPQSVPYKAGRVDLTGSDTAAKHAKVCAAIVENERQRHEAKWDDWQKIEKLIDEYIPLLLRKVALEDELAALPYSSPTRAGILGLYAVTVPPVLLCNPLLGIGEGMRAGERWELDTRGWGGELREKLDAFLAACDPEQPNRTRSLIEYKDTPHQAFYWRSRATQGERWLLTTSLPLLRRLDIWL